MRTNLPVTQREYTYSETDAIVSTTDLRGKINYCNSTFVQISGYTREELIGQPQNILRHPDMPREAFRDLWATIKSRQPWSAIVKNRRKDGDHYWVRANVTPIIAGDNVVGYMSVRTYPSREDVRVAEQLYAQMVEDEKAGRPTRIYLRAGQPVRRGWLPRLVRAFTRRVEWRLVAAATLIACGPLLPHVFHLPARHEEVATLACMVLGIVVGTRLLRSQMSAPLRRFADSANTMAACDLADGDDKAAAKGSAMALARALNQLNVNLRAVVSDVRGEVSAVNQASAQVSRGAQDLAARTETQAASLEQAAAAMEEFTGALQQSRERAQEAKQQSGTAEQAAHEGSVAIGEVDTAMKAILAASQNISEVTSLVDELAFQSNLLALNASVEAARAGEHGRGFAVVAGEVRSLAQRSADAARDIRRLINTSMQQVEAGGTAVDGARSRMQAIVDSVSRVRQLIEDISSATAEQANGVSQINDTISQLDSVTQHNVALVAESTATTQTLRDRAKLLEQSVAIFRLAQGGSGTGQPVSARERRTDSDGVRWLTSA
ncbi:PAS domain-containing methyl-accepting chemotaxis protein [Oleiagrimonas sp. C23AA]|uniref:methyl-accepting chemotaxis protein n=1 Tax=Oleiagrimonas sp. C23AA TaxID=2719047 RepID=UPI0014217280|nr:PAS domain-containing methyl-accepting chemotaxis protein [Oleiagrimonas sp. C23AA]NII12242.1 PAS domain S-box protein [Oleiagrimonas sp. C23AA]